MPMACATRAVLSAGSCAFPSHRRRALHRPRRTRGDAGLFALAAGSEDDCNVEECAPEKEEHAIRPDELNSGPIGGGFQVGKLSGEWLAGEKTKVLGTFPPKNRSWTGYVEKDTAGQTNIYSVEPAVYVADSALSSGAAGSSVEGSQKIATIAAGVALISVAAASSILVQLGKNAPSVQTTPYSGPPLSYYINRFKSITFVEAAVPSKVQGSLTAKSEGSSEVPLVPDSSTMQSEVSEVVPQVTVSQTAQSEATLQVPQDLDAPQVRVQENLQLDSQAQDVSSSP